MADQLQLRGGSTSQNLSFTGAQREVVVDTTLNALVVHNGITAGGFYVATAKQVTGGTFYYNEDVGSAANAYILTPKANTNAPSSYLDGVQFGFVTAFANTGPSTANFQGLGVKNLKYPGGIDPLAGEIFGRTYLIYDSANDWMEIQRKALGPPPQLRTIGASVSSNAMTVNLQPCFIDFRATSLGSGTINSRSVSTAISLVVPAGATLGTASAVQSRIMLLAILGPSNVELAVVNLSGGVNLDETTLINTTAITSGSGANNVIYSTTSRTGVPFRVLGYVESTQTTAGTWATVPSTIQGAGGQAMAAFGSLGFGQTYQDVTGSRTFGSNFTNTSGKPLFLFVQAVSTVVTGFSITVQGVTFSGNSAAIGNAFSLCAIIPPGAVYVVATPAGSLSSPKWVELR